MRRSGRTQSSGRVSIVEDDAARLHLGEELAQRRFVQGEQDVRTRDERRRDRLIRRSPRDNSTCPSASQDPKKAARRLRTLPPCPPSPNTYPTVRTPCPPKLATRMRRSSGRSGFGRAELSSPARPSSAGISRRMAAPVERSAVSRPSCDRGSSPPGRFWPFRRARTSGRPQVRVSKRSGTATALRRTRIPSLWPDFSPRGESL
jgi:hypothetical protein